MMNYFKQVKARLPNTNPNDDPGRYKASKEYEKRMTWGPFEDRRSLGEDEKPQKKIKSTQ
jgi:hypothetical protein